MPASLHEYVESLLADLTNEVRRHYGERLVSLVVFGSMGRGTPRPDSDLDVLIVADDLPNGRVRRVEEFTPVEASRGPRLNHGRRAGTCPWRKAI